MEANKMGQVIHRIVSPFTDPWNESKSIIFPFYPYDTRVNEIVHVACFQVPTPICLASPPIFEFSVIFPVQGALSLSLDHSISLSQFSNPFDKFSPLRKASVDREEEHSQIEFSKQNINFFNQAHPESDRFHTFQLWYAHFFFSYSMISLNFLFGLLRKSRITKQTSWMISFFLI